MELRMPVAYPGAAVGGGDALNGQTFFALSTPQQRAMFTFWTTPGEFLVRVTHPTFVKWLVPAGIYFADPTAAGQSCAASHVLESLFLGACCLDPAIAGTAEDQFGDTFVTPNTLAAALDALVNAGLDLTLPVPLPADPSAVLNILDARITALLGSNRAPDAIVIGDSQLIMCHTGGHEVPQLPDPGLDVGWTDFIRFSDLAGFDGRLGPAGDLRALAGHFVLRAWRHNANGRYQIVLQTIAAHIWRNPAYMGLPWEVAPQLAAQFIVRTSWPGQLRLLYHAFPGVLEDVQLRFDYEVQTDAATKRIMLARLPSLLRAFVHVGALLGDVPPAEALGLAEHLVACTSDGASTTVSVGSFTTLNAYLASRRAEIDRLRTEPAPLRVHAIEDAHRRATLDAAAAPMMLTPADGASADGTLGATKSAIGQTLTKPYRNDVSLLLDSAAIAGPLVTRARQRGDPAGVGQVVDNTRSGLFALLNQPTVVSQPAEQLRLALAVGNQILTQFIASTLHLDHPLFRLLAMARSSLTKMISTAMVMTTAGGISDRDKTFDVDEHIPGFCQEIIEGKFSRNWWKVLEAITTHRKAPVAPVDISEQWLQPRSTELAAIADSIVSTLGFVPSPAYSFLGFLSTCAQFTAAMPPELARDKIKAALMEMAVLPPAKRWDTMLRGAPGIPVPESFLLGTDKCFLEMANMRSGTDQLMGLEAVLPGAINNLGAFPRSPPAQAPAPAPAAPTPPGSATKKRKGPNMGNPPGTPGRVPAAISGSHAALGGGTQQAGGLKPGSLASSCKMNGGDLNMTVAPGAHSSSTTDRKFIIHVGQFCKDNNIDQNAVCWPFLAEVARVNGNHFKGSAGARPVLDIVALARCPNAHDPTHCRAKHRLLSDALMLELNTPTYFRSA